MSEYGIDSLRERYEQNKKSNSYVVINNIRVDFRDLKRIDKYSIIKTDNDEDKEVLTELDLKVLNFEGILNSYCYELMSKNIPFDQIRITGEPGIIIKSTKHREILEDYIKTNYEKCKGSMFRSEIGWTDIDSNHYINNLTINDVLYNYVPLNFTIEPFITIDDKDTREQKLRSSFTYLGLDSDSEIKYSSIVPFNEFVKGINKDGYYLLFNGDLVKTYDEYFEHMVKLSYDDELSINIDFNNENNKRR